MKKLLYSGFTTLMMLLAFMGVSKAQTVTFSPDPSAGAVTAGTTVTITVTGLGSDESVYYNEYASLAAAQNDNKWNDPDNFSSFFAFDSRPSFSIDPNNPVIRVGILDGEAWAWTKTDIYANYSIGSSGPNVTFSPDPDAGAVTAGTTVTITVTGLSSDESVYYNEYASLAAAQNDNKWNDPDNFSSFFAFDTRPTFSIDASSPIIRVGILDGEAWAWTKTDIYAEYTITGATPAPEVVATPTFSPVAGEVQVGAEVTISCTTQDAIIYYTTDGTTPNEQANRYSSPITINEATTIKAIATKEGMTASEVATAAYTIPEPVPDFKLTFSPDGSSNVGEEEPITITATPDINATKFQIYWQVYASKEEAKNAVWAEGTLFPADVEIYNTQVLPKITTGKTVLRAAVLNKTDKTWIASSDTIREYIIGQREPFVISFAPEAGEVEANTSVTLSTIPTLTEGFDLYYKFYESVAQAENDNWTDLSFETTLTKYTTSAKPVITEAKPILKMAIWNTTTSQWESDTIAEYTIQEDEPDPTKPAAPEFSVAAGAVDSNSTVTIAKGTADSIFVAFGKTATEAVAFAKYTANLTVTIVKDTVIRAYAMKDGLYSDTITRAYTLKPAVVPTPDTVKMPTFSVVAGEVEKGTKVTLACATEGAKIYYTVNGDAPTAQSTEYTAEIAIDSAMTIKAIAIKEGMENSKVAEAAYTIKTVANEDAELAGVRLYPNPNNGEFNVSVPVRVQVEVFTVNGTLVKALTIAQGNTPIRLENSGIYFVRFTAENGQATVKRVIVR